MPPKNPLPAGDDLVPRVREVIAAGDRRTALALLHELMERPESTVSLSTVLGDALVAIASGTGQGSDA
jgi:hypothetical protein